MKNLNLVLLMVFSMHLNAANFLIWNASCPNMLNGANTLFTEFRMRIIADELYGKNLAEISSYIEKNSSSIPKISLPEAQEESSVEKIFGGKASSKKITILLTGTCYFFNSFKNSSLIFSEHILLDDPLEENNTLMVTIKNITLEDGKIKLDYELLTDKAKNDFTSLTKNVTPF